MATSTQSSSKKSASSRKSTTKKSSTAQQDAVTLLKADHREVEKLFGQFEKAKGDAQKQKIAGKICMELKIHTRIEEEIFYPISRDYLDDEEIVNEAVVEHASAKDLIAQIETMQPSDDLYDAKVTVLKEMIEHHVEEEEKEYFPKVKKTDMDLKAVGDRLTARKKELKQEMGGDGRAMH